MLRLQNEADREEAIKAEILASQQEEPGSPMQDQLAYGSEYSNDYPMSLDEASYRNPEVEQVCALKPWWRHAMETYSAFIRPFRGESTVGQWFTSQRTSNVEGWCFLYLLNKQLNCWLFETRPCDNPFTSFESTVNKKGCLARSTIKIGDHAYSRQTCCSVVMCMQNR